MTLQGYRRTDGRIGIRNHVLVMSTVQCANQVVELIHRRVPEVAPVQHVYGCSFDVAGSAVVNRTLLGFGAHPNVYGVVLVSLGCETTPCARLRDDIAATGRKVELVGIQDIGGTLAAAERGVELAAQWLAEARQLTPEPFSFDELTVGLECGGSDAFSGLSANPATGAASDRLVDAGATVILSEVSEIIGAEHILARRCVDEDVRQHLLAVVGSAETAFARCSPDADGVYITPGNIEGGLTTIEEKSLGCIHKAGQRPVVEVVQYANRPARSGLVVMDTPGYDVSSITGMVAGGAQLAIFTTGRGSPTGCPIAPVIKVASNRRTATRMADNIDVDAGAILLGEATIDEVGERIFNRVAEVVSGERTKSELLGHHEFAIAAPSIYFCREELQWQAATPAGVT